MNELKSYKDLEEENRNDKARYADPALDNKIPKKILGKVLGPSKKRERVEYLQKR